MPYNRYLFSLCCLSSVSHQQWLDITNLLSTASILHYFFTFSILDEGGGKSKGSLNEELTMQCSSFYICYCTKQVRILEQACEHDLRSIFQSLYENNLIERNILKKVRMSIYKLYQWIQWLKRFDFNYFHWVIVL